MVPKRRKEKTISPYAYMGLSIINPLSLANALMAPSR